VLFILSVIRDKAICVVFIYRTYLLLIKTLTGIIAEFCKIDNIADKKKFGTDEKLLAENTR
jgi:hypothetical protein